MWDVTDGDVPGHATAKFVAAVLHVFVLVYNQLCLVRLRVVDLSYMM